MTETVIDAATVVLLDVLATRPDLTRAALAQCVADAGYVLSGHDLILLLAELGSAA